MGVGSLSYSEKALESNRCAKRNNNSQVEIPSSRVKEFVHMLWGRIRLMGHTKRCRCRG